MTITTVHPSIENLQSFSEFFDLEKVLQSDGVLPWLLANGWNYDDQSCLIANIVDESTSIWGKYEDTVGEILLNNFDNVILHENSDYFRSDRIIKS
ncbi:hypothetical protein [uncultured Nostoc sp.]|uniref:hypothetical protein n=1 Tax=uncultured Nostoc sp. TaxID=340711 RepID=UPI0035C99CED